MVRLSWVGVAVFWLLAGLSLVVAACSGWEPTTTSVTSSTNVSTSTTEATTTSLAPPTTAVMDPLPPSTTSTLSTTSDISTSSTVAGSEEPDIPWGYEVIVGCFAVTDAGAEADARALAAKLKAQGFEPGVLLSDDYASLRSGYRVTYLGTGAYEDAVTLRARLREQGYADAYIAEVSQVATIRLAALSGLEGNTYLPAIASAPGEISNIELHRAGGQEWYRFRAVHEGYSFLVTVGASNFFEGPHEGPGPDMSHTVDISSSVKTPAGWTTRVLVYSETAPRASLEAFAAALDIPGRE